MSNNFTKMESKLGLLDTDLTNQAVAHERLATAVYDRLDTLTAHVTANQETARNDLLERNKKLYDVIRQKTRNEMQKVAESLYSSIAQSLGTVKSQMIATQSDTERMKESFQETVDKALEAFKLQITEVTQPDADRLIDDLHTYVERSLEPVKSQIVSVQSQFGETAGAIMARLDEIDQRVQQSNCPPTLCKAAASGSTEEIRNTTPDPIEELAQVIQKRPKQEVKFDHPLDGEEEFVRDYQHLTNLEDAPEREESSSRSDVGYMLSHFCRMQALADLEEPATEGDINRAHAQYVDVALTHPSLGEYFEARKTQGRGRWWLDTPVIERMLTVPNKLSPAADDLLRCDRCSRCRTPGDSFHMRQGKCEAVLNVHHPDNQHFSTNVQTRLFTFCDACTDLYAPPQAFLVRVHRDYATVQRSVFYYEYTDGELSFDTRPTESETWVFHGVPLTYEVAQVEDSTIETRSVSASAEVRLPQTVQPKDINEMLKAVAKHATEHLTKLNPADITWKGVYNLGKTVFEIEEYIDNDARIRFWRTLPVSQKHCTMADILFEIVQHVLLENSSLRTLVSTDKRTARAAIQDIPSMTQYLAMQCITQEAVVDFNLLLPHQPPAEIPRNFDKLLNWFSVAASITPILGKLYADIPVHQVLREEMPLYIFHSLEPTTRKNVLNKMIDAGATLEMGPNKGEPVNLRNMTVEWLRNTCKRLQEAGVRSKRWTTKKFAAFINDSEVRQSIEDVVQEHLNVTRMEDETSTQLTRMEHAYKRDPKKQQPKPRKQGNPGIIRSGANGQPRAYATLQAAMSSKQPSKEHPCRICGSPDHWQNSCPKRFDKSLRDKKISETRRLFTAKIAAAAKSGNHGMCTKLSVMNSLDEAHIAEILDEVDPEDEQTSPTSSPPGTDSEPDDLSDTASVREGDEEIRIDSPFPSDTEPEDASSDAEGKA